MGRHSEENTARSAPDFAVLVLVLVGGWWLFRASPPIIIKPPAPHPLCRGVNYPLIAAKSYNNCVSPADIDLMTRVAVFEARHEPELGKIAVAHVIKNRWHKNPYGWETISDVVTAKKQFEPWYLHKEKVMNLDSNGEEYKRMKLIAIEALEGRTADPTNGAFYFLNVAVVKKRGMSKEWKKIIAQKACVDIARHRFCPSLKK